MYQTGVPCTSPAWRTGAGTCHNHRCPKKREYSQRFPEKNRRYGGGLRLLMHHGCFPDLRLNDIFPDACVRNNDYRYPSDGSVDITLRGEVVCPANPVQHPLALRAEMGSGRGSTATAAVFQEKLLGTFFATVTVHSPDLCPSSELNLPSARGRTPRQLSAQVCRNKVRRLAIAPLQEYDPGTPDLPVRDTRTGSKWGDHPRISRYGETIQITNRNRIFRYEDTRTGSKRGDYPRVSRYGKTIQITNRPGSSGTGIPEQEANRGSPRQGGTPAPGCQSRLEGGEPPRCRLPLSHDRHDLV